MFYSSIFLLICPVKSSPLLSNAKVSSVSPPLNSPASPFAWWRTVQVYRWEELPENSLRLFSPQKTGKWKQMAGGWKYTTLKKTFALAHSMPSSVTFIVTELSEQGIKSIRISGSGIWRELVARDLGEHKISDRIRHLTATQRAFITFARDMVFKKKMVFGIEMTEFRDSEMLWKRNRNGGSKLPAGLDPSYRSDTFTQDGQLEPLQL